MANGTPTYTNEQLAEKRTTLSAMLDIDYADAVALDDSEQAKQIAERIAAEQEEARRAREAVALAKEAAIAARAIEKAAKQEAAARELADRMARQLGIAKANAALASDGDDNDGGIDDDDDQCGVELNIEMPSGVPCLRTDGGWDIEPLIQPPGTYAYYNFDNLGAPRVPGHAGASSPRGSRVPAAIRPRIQFLSDPRIVGEEPPPEPPHSGISTAQGHGQHDVAHLSSRGTHDTAHQAGDDELQSREVVIDENGQPRQAGATMPEGEFIKRFRLRAEQSLFIFLKGVLGRFFLTSHFHRDICHFIQQCPPHRKLILMPREHAKTTIVAGGLPPHILIQPAATNIYFPGLEGSECRILLSGETAPMAQKNLRVVKSVFMENKIFRAFWPHRVWDSERAARTWNNDSIIIPRENEWPDPTIKAIGVGGAITGARPNVMIKDDLVTFDAANSNVTMDMAIEWHKASRALLDTYEVESGLQSLEFIIGTRWAVFDLYSYIIDNDPSVQVNDERFHRIIRDGKILWPEKYTLPMIEQLQREHGSNFYLLYLNSVADPALTDFDMSLVRPFTIADGKVLFEDDPRDAFLIKRNDVRAARDRGDAPPTVLPPGERITAALLARLVDGGGGVRLRG